MAPAHRMTSVLSGLGLCAFFWILSSAFSLGLSREVTGPFVIQSSGTGHRKDVRFLAVGDVNLGRVVGQEILKGDTLYPFRFVRDTFASHDIIFANLESQLSDQGGETQHPRSNLTFTGPPAGGFSLQRGGITVVSTANNHALDYGTRAHSETMINLSRARVKFSGTSTADSLLFEPLLFLQKGIRFALFSCTDVMNREDSEWKQYVTPADSLRLFPRIRSFRGKTDFIILSYHGGEEYSAKPSEKTKAFARAGIEAGVDLFLGHHPHVPHGVEEIKGKLIVYSLGNFVFHQPFNPWTQRSFALSATISKIAGRTTITRIACLPVVAGRQPRFVSDTTETRIIMARVKSLSTLRPEHREWFE